MFLIEDHAQQAGIPLRFAASIAEGDALIAEQLHLDVNEKRTIEHILKQLEAERGLDRAAAIATCASVSLTTSVRKPSLSLTPAKNICEALKSTAF